MILLSCADSGSNKQNLITLFIPFSGEWISNDSTVLEKWQVLDDGISAKVYSLSGIDSILTETIEIINDNDTVYYQATVFNQNEGKPIRFKLVSADSMNFVFENKAHDFPQRIEYYFVNKTNVRVSISSQYKGKKKEFLSNYSRINP